MPVHYFITMTLLYVLKSKMAIPPVLFSLFFFIGLHLIIQDLWCFHINLMMLFLISMKNVVGTLFGILLTL